MRSLKILFSLWIGLLILGGVKVVFLIKYSNYFSIFLKQGAEENEYIETLENPNGNTTKIFATDQGIRGTKQLAETTVSNETHNNLQFTDLFLRVNINECLDTNWPEGENWPKYLPFSNTADHTWNEANKLKIYLVPHSHNDPGWRQSFEDYYHHNTRSILNNIVKYLSLDYQLKFIWAETSFLSLFWEEIDNRTKRKFTMLLENGQLEIVNGGWVVNDEANTHYFGILQQMIEGHQWILQHMNYTPKNSWAIDPFGYSPTMPFLLKEMGFQNLVIQRVHYAVKHYLALSQNLEFYWRQEWDNSKKSDLFTHIMPFSGYGIRDTCGPNKAICYQFDFLNVGKVSRWDAPQVITKENIRERANVLLNQYYKKAKIFRTNVLLVPLGDDFRFKTQKEFHLQFKNYHKLIEYMNRNKSMHVEAKFGTLEDYFQALHKYHPSQKFGVFSGDFFPYSDYSNYYWSGYFTSRPFHKRMDRILLSNLRSAEVLFVLALAEANDKTKTKWLKYKLYKQLTQARRHISLFQHHDAITGTARKNVMRDYLNKMDEANKQLQNIMQQTVYIVLSNHLQTPFMDTLEIVYFTVNDHEKPYNDFSDKINLEIEGRSNPKKIVIFNPLTWRRQQIISIEVNTHNVKVTASDGNPVTSQTSPVFSHFGGMINNRYRLYFEVDVGPLSLKTYFIHFVSHNLENKSNILSTIKIYNFIGPIHVSKGFEHTEKIAKVTEFSLSNRILKAHFSRSGFLKALSFSGTNDILPIQIGFVLYKAKKDSGAYIFNPHGAAKSIFVDPNTSIRIINGPHFSQTDVELEIVKHSVRIYQTNGLASLGLEITNYVNILDLHNSELAMRITSNIKNRNTFFTDLNGLQMIQRKYSGKLPIEGNYYPMTTSAYIEDENNRLSIISGQPGGFSSLKEGQIEIMQDRRLSQDDHRGLGEGVLDNMPFNTMYTILFEKKESSGAIENHKLATLSRFGHLTSHSILYPLISFWPKGEQTSLKLKFSPISQDLDHDIHIVKMHPLLNNTVMKIGIIFHRNAIDSRFPTKGIQFMHGNGIINFTSLFPQHFGDTIMPTSLSFLHSKRSISKGDIEQISPMEMKAYLLSL